MYYFNNKKTILYTFYRVHYYLINEKKYYIFKKIFMGTFLRLNGF